jgi:uncharacterized protein (DUF1800 family)
MAIPFGIPEASHLLRRAAARGRRGEAEQLVNLGLEGAIAQLLRPPVSPPPVTFDPANRSSEQTLARLWLEWWLTTPTPAAERLVLFWHGHFTSEIREVRSPYSMWSQFQTFRNQGTGSFADLLLAVARDPAMLVYLDNATSRKTAPNENWARELLELFTVGPGFYTEQDILESARAFTGWTVRSLEEPRSPDRAFGRFEFTFNRSWADLNPKTYLGRTIQSGEEVIEILANHPQTYRFIAQKLLAFYFHPEPTALQIEMAARVLQQDGCYGFLSWLFSRDFFYSKAARQSLIRSPVEYLIGLAHSAGLSTLEQRITNALALMGQVPFQPPGVKGWDGGKAWLGEPALLARINLLSALTNQSSSLDLSVFMDGGNLATELVKPEAQLL